VDSDEHKEIYNPLSLVEDPAIFMAGGERKGNNNIQTKDE
jgi:hypothetical protein